jgi:hypothetical protein
MNEFLILLDKLEEIRHLIENAQYVAESPAGNHTDEQRASAKIAATNIFNAIKLLESASDVKNKNHPSHSAKQITDDKQIIENLTTANDHLHKRIKILKRRIERNRHLMTE